MSSHGLVAPLPWFCRLYCDVSFEVLRMFCHRFVTVWPRFCRSCRSRSWSGRWTQTQGSADVLPWICHSFATVLPLVQVQELELKVDPNSIARLLNFLSHSFMGGTDVDRPLELSLQRLAHEEWSQVRQSVRSAQTMPRMRQCWMHCMCVHLGGPAE
jgi:hypothetical protein